ncbi:MAG: hypothetical protein KGY61_10000 [Desulfobacterales bacterium]|nr:hypothetical protein [Desulfobacterales bacterium]
MITCSLNNFMEAVKPWLSGDYIREAYVDEQGRFVLDFNDGVRNIYAIDDCTAAQMADILADFKKKGIPVRG